VLVGSGKQFAVNNSITLTGTDGATIAYPTPSLVSVVADCEQFCTLTSAYTLASQTAAQKLFNASTNGAVTLPTGSYFFECFISLSSLSTSNSIFGFALTAGTATIASQAWKSDANCGTLATAAQTILHYQYGRQHSNCWWNSTSGLGWAKITGKVRITGAGTVIPQVSLNTAAAAIVGADSYFRIWSAGTSSVTTAGTWS